MFSVEPLPSHLSPASITATSQTKWITVTTIDSQIQITFKSQEKQRKNTFYHLICHKEGHTHSSSDDREWRPLSPVLTMITLTSWRITLSVHCTPNIWAHSMNGTHFMHSTRSHRHRDTCDYSCSVWVMLRRSSTVHQQEESRFASQQWGRNINKTC